MDGLFVAEEVQVSNRSCANKVCKRVAPPLHIVLAAHETTARDEMLSR